MTMTERSTAVGVFTERSQAERTIAELRHAGFGDDQIGFVARDNDKMANNSMGNGDARTETVASAATGAISGGIIGGVAGAAASLLMPALGPAIAGGILGIALGGAALGAAAGGFAGALAAMGVPEEEARYYESQLGSGRVILTVDAPGRYQEAVAILRANGAYDAVSYSSQRIGNNDGIPATVQEAPSEFDQQNDGIVPGFGTYTHTIGPEVEYSRWGSQVEAPRDENVPPGPGSPTHEYPPGSPENVPPGPGSPAHEYPPGSPENVPPGPGSPAHEYPPGSPENVPPGPGGVTREGTEEEPTSPLPRPEPDVYTPASPAVPPGPGNPPVPEEANQDASEETRKLKRPEVRPGGDNIPLGGSDR